LMYVKISTHEAKSDMSLKSSFMSVEWSDPHKSLSYNHMHCDSHGLGGKHIWPSVRIYIRASGREALAELDKRSVYQLDFVSNFLTQRCSDSMICLPGVV
jgi:hypothetical protein